ncbi:DNA-binding transcriptional MerR regulator [Brevibacillus aydinogluensis]|uniref:MerR family transcriptional regulator n=1 Tax=Brevibacillus aydinogluensis TaxID=927786 RepID=UPI002892F4C2|nr:MerR family transcriptional regulator [Brevibacillus aydinogluensis]MDT3418206.1 DNA-binding transcriptional MerR regulator [Brevibacillus aydinogluensis]
MIKTENQSKEKADNNIGGDLLTIKQAADRIKEPVHIVRNWLRDLRPYVPVEKGENGYNLFGEPGLKALLTIQDLHRNRGYSIKQIEHFFATGGKEFIPLPEPAAEEMLAKELQMLRSMIQEMQDRFERQEQFNMALTQKLDEQTAYIDRAINNRDKELMQGLERIFERYQQKQLEAPKTEKKWWKFWT